MKTKFISRDLKDKNGCRYIERQRMHLEFDQFGNILNLGECTRECTFLRRGECYLRDFLGEDISCNHRYYWQRVDENGWLRDRDGWIGLKPLMSDDKGVDNPFAIRIDENRKQIDKYGNPVGKIIKGKFVQNKI